MYTVMAASSSKATAVFRSLEEEVKCPLCLEVYSSPKRLPCEHVFCIGCLATLIQKSLQRKQTLECPLCRSTFSLTGNADLEEQFSTAHQVNRLIDIYRQSLKELGDSKSDWNLVSCKNSPHHCLDGDCPVHGTTLSSSCDDAHLNRGCEDCDRNMCMKECGSLNNPTKFLKTLDDDLSPVRELCKKLETLQGDAAAISKTLSDEEFMAVTKVEKSFELFSDLLEKNKRHQISEIKDHFRGLQLSNESKRREILHAVDELEAFLQSAAAISTDYSHSEFFQAVKIKKQQGQRFLSQFGKLSHQHFQVQSQQFVVKLPDVNKLKKIFRSDHCHRKETIQVDIKDQNLELVVDKPFQTDVEMQPMTDIRELKAKLVCLYSDTSEPINITQISHTTFRLAGTPKTRGHHQIHILCCCNHLVGSSIVLTVAIPPHCLPLLEKNCTIMKSLHNPHSLKYHQGKLYVMDEGQGIKVVERPERSLTICDTLPVSVNGELLVHKDSIYLTDQDECRLVEMDRRGNMLNSVGSRDFSKIAYFSQPNGIRMNEKKHIYICDSGNHCIHMFDTTLKFLRTIGQKGGKRGEFYSLDDLIFDSDGNMYVVEQHNHRVQVLTKNLRFLRFIGSPEVLNNPTSAEIFGEFIFVVNFGRHCLSVFSLEGEFVTNFGKGVLYEPECVAIDENGFVYVTNNSKNLVRF